MGFADATVRAACPSGRSSGARPSGIGSAAARWPLFLTGWAILQCGTGLAGAGVRFYKRFSLAPYQQWLVSGAPGARGLGHALDRRAICGRRMVGPWRER